MSLFQKAVLNKHLKQQDKNVVSKAYKKFTKYFHNPTIQQNIRDIKEEGFQQKFLMELFVTVFGYTINPDPKYNLTTEFKNEKDAKKADGAILKDGKAIGVIELKGTKTKDLEKVRQQAFDYKANQTGCVYVITSNFEKIRFYVNNAVEFEEFDLFTINEERFELLYLCLAKDNVLNNIPLRIKEASIQEEEKITKKFYGDYSQFKRELFRDLVKLNMKNEAFRDELNNEDSERANKNIKHHLFKKSQKLIDRFLFIFFAEDRGLLPPNSTLKILEQWNKLKELDEVVPLYNRYKKYFDYLDQGRKGTDKTTEIFAYNGGLFQPDATLDSLIISDDLLYKHTKDLSHYDFDSQVDVNILGHIFENSLNEIESVNAEIEGTDFDKQKTKRKKDGVFYTPKYITKYIVDNTVGKLCTEKKDELGILEEEYFKSRKGRTTKKLKELQDKLEAYRKWLLQLTILDPACGSGAFLNQALDFLIKEHGYIDELQTNLLGGGFVFPNIENTVLENNIFGVDLNEESIEIAKLSLWLRTAQPRRKLNVLSNNIKCGNSLIDSKAVAGDKAFNWKEEFHEIFEKGGFDVVIGNPPYVRQELLAPYKDYFQKNYKSFAGTADLYTYFIEKSVDELINLNGVYSVIVANKWMRAKYGLPLRTWMKEKEIEEIIDFKDLPVFQDAATYPCIITLHKEKKTDDINVCEPVDLKFGDLGVYVKTNRFTVRESQLEDSGWSLVNSSISNLLTKIKSSGVPLGEYVNNNIFRGVTTGLNEAFIIDKSIRDDLISKDSNSKQLLKPIIAGRDLKRYKIDFQERYLIFTRRGVDLDKYPAIKEYLLKFKSKLEPKPKDFVGEWKGRKPGSYKWYEIQDSVDYFEEFEKPKLILSDISLTGNFAFDSENNYYCVNTCYVIQTDKDWLESLLNSKLISFYYKHISPEFRGGYLRFIYQYLITIPILKGDALTAINEEIRERISLFTKLNLEMLRYLNSSINIEVSSKKLQNWHELDFGDFIKELNKTIKKAGGEKLTKTDEMDWMDVFETKKAEAQTLKAEIDKADAEIDAMVYELYGLSEEEIKIVENS